MITIPRPSHPALKVPTSEECKIRQVTQIEEMEAVYRLTHDCYVSKGYASPQKNNLLLHYPEFDIIPDTTVLIALLDGEIVGSMSLTLTGPYGFPIDHEFEGERQNIAKEGRIMVNVWRLVVNEACRTSRKVVFGLFAEGFRRTLEQKVTTWLLTVNPQHAGLYQRLLNARVIATRSATEGLSDAPAVLLRFDRETLPENWKLAETAIYAHEPLGLTTLECLMDPLSDLPLPTLPV